MGPEIYSEARSRTRIQDSYQGMAFSHAVSALNRSYGTTESRARYEHQSNPVHSSNCISRVSIEANPE